MWRTDGQFVVYLYDMLSQNYGTDIDVNHPEFFYFQPGKWHTVKQHIPNTAPTCYNQVVRST
ncbi:MAG: hypothetical protein GF398_01610 [Chitinivibrionales bacterium]|nr:hypothetical protein [Chitinivibrionales bacterium]